MNRFMKTLLKFIEGGLLGSCITFGTLTLVWAFFFAANKTLSLFSLTLFWGLMSFISGLLYFGLVWIMEGDN